MARPLASRQARSVVSMGTMPQDTSSEMRMDARISSMCASQYSIGSSPRLRATLEPVLEFLRAIPPPVLVPSFILVAGIGTTMKVLVIASGCLWPILLNTIDGVRGVERQQLDAARSYQIPVRARLTRIVLPAASPRIFASAISGSTVKLAKVEQPM